MTMTQRNEQHDQQHTQQNQPQMLDHFIRQEINAISALNDSHLRQILDYSKGFLDKVFPLEHGSHKDVLSYVVYYQHLLAFLKDGSNSGLADPTQFVALCGSKQKPQSVLLRGEGRHVELVFCGSGQHGARDNAGIEDIQLEIAAEQPELSPRWFSMMDGQLRSDQLPGCRGTCFTAKDGGDYQL
ncbi:malate synthase [Rheinheimera sp. SA_1]|uniref:malate synthase n=1 Tax=Rheinheimera sp. SA_1 TaxID=1827365 RepID=UPI000AC2C966|nr:malate synthase [Rheinheimera sp. SA_1]